MSEGMSPSNVIEADFSQARAATEKPQPVEVIGMGIRTVDQKGNPAIVGIVENHEHKGFSDPTAAKLYGIASRIMEARAA